MLSVRDVGVVRDMYRAIAAQDMPAIERCFAPGAVWHIPGASAIAGHHSGWSQIRDGFLVKLGPLSGHTFRADLIDIAVGQQFLIAVQHATGHHRGRTLDITGCQLITTDAGRIHEVRGHYSDQEALDRFWQWDEAVLEVPFTCNASELRRV